MIDPLVLGACGGLAVIGAYLLGRWHGLEIGLRAADQAARDWPASLQGDLRNVSVHIRESAR